MAIVRYTFDPADPPRFSTEELARLDALTDEQITRAAESDPDNPPLTEEEMRRMETVVAVRNAREAAGLTQAAFAETYALSLGRLRDLEQGRHGADTAMLYLLKRIAKDPAEVRGELDLFATRDMTAA